MDGITEAIEERCEAGMVGEAVRLLGGGADAPSRLFKQRLLQKIIDLLTDLGAGTLGLKTGDAQNGCRCDDAQDTRRFRPQVVIDHRHARTRDERQHAD